MAESKFLKAYCSRTKQYFGLEIKKFGSVWKVVNMTHLSPTEAKLLSSEVEQSYFETNENLLACRGCASRRVGGCKCSRREHQCSAGKYHFDCIYCNELKIDYTLPTEDEVGRQAGDTVTLSQGQEVKIRYADNRPLKKISVGIGWDPTGILSKNMDVDSSVVVISPNGREKDLVYFGDLSHPTGCVVHHGDNLTGEGGIQDGDDENIDVYLDKVPSDRDKLVFVLNIYDCDDRNQTLRKVKNLYIKLYDPDSGKTLIQYRVNDNMGNDTAIVIGMAYKKGGSWMFKAIGRTLTVSNVYELKDLCVRYI